MLFPAAGSPAAGSPPPPPIADSTWSSLASSGFILASSCSCVTYFGSAAGSAGGSGLAGSLIASSSPHLLGRTGHLHERPGVPVAPQRVKQRRELGQCRGQRLKLPQDYLEQFPVTESYRLGYFSHTANIAPACLEFGATGVLTRPAPPRGARAAIAPGPPPKFV